MKHIVIDSVREEIRLSEVCGVREPIFVKGNGLFVGMIIYEKKSSDIPFGGWTIHFGGALLRSNNPHYEKLEDCIKENDSSYSFYIDRND